VRNPVTAAVVAVFLAHGVAAQDPAPRPTAQCGDATECHQRALEAAERKDYETFHDLAWRTVQLGPKNDPSLLFLLARAQSLSGRPLDALVMLRRLAPTGVAAGALTSVEFERVRGLKGWPEVEALLGGAAASSAVSPPPTARPEAVPPAAPAPAPPPVVPAEARPAEPMTFAAASFKPAALAYDAVSRRYIISDTDVSRLAVIDEFSHQLATLASGKSAGFGVVTAIAIDPREGNLWVASVDGESGEDVPAVHKLQLISGRVLKKFSAAKPIAGRLADIAIGSDGALLAVQESGRIVRLPAGAASFEVAASIGGSVFTSIATSNQGGVYVARPDGLLRFRPSPSVEVRAAHGLDLTGLARIRWIHGSLVGLQRVPDGSYRAVRIHLSRDGRTATALDVLDESVRTPNPAAATVSGDAFYYLADTGGSETAIRRVIIK
jgi:hypothetical protein